MWNAPHCSAAMPSATSCGAAVDQPRLLGAVLHRLARDLVVVGLVGLAQVGGVGVGNRALVAHPVQRGAGVEAAGERDADLLADGKVLPRMVAMVHDLADP
jgi:hypothetical protein